MKCLINGSHCLEHPMEKYIDRTTLDKFFCVYLTFQLWALCQNDYEKTN